MKEIYLQKSTIIEETESPISGNYKKRLRNWTLTLYLSVITGIISAISGLVLGAVSYGGFITNADSINQIGNFMIIAAFPLMMLGAHALDKINELKMGKKRL